MAINVKIPCKVVQALQMVRGCRPSSGLWYARSVVCSRDTFCTGILLKAHNNNYWSNPYVQDSTLSVPLLLWGVGCSFFLMGP